jgi:hypothetical protein
MAFEPLNPLFFGRYTAKVTFAKQAGAHERSCTSWKNFAICHVQQSGGWESANTNSTTKRERLRKTHSRHPDRPSVVFKATPSFPQQEREERFMDMNVRYRIS